MQVFRYNIMQISELSILFTALGLGKYPESEKNYEIGFIYPE
jgi:hypothetical protein